MRRPGGGGGGGGRGAGAFGAASRTAACCLNLPSSEAGGSRLGACGVDTSGPSPGWALTLPAPALPHPPRSPQEMKHRTYYLSNGTIRVAGKLITRCAEPYAEGDLISVQLDMELRHVSFLKNNQLQGAGDGLPGGCGCGWPGVAGRGWLRGPWTPQRLRLVVPVWAKQKQNSERGGWAPQRCCRCCPVQKRCKGGGLRTRNPCTLACGVWCWAPVPAAAQHLLNSPLLLPSLSPSLPLPARPRAPLQSHTHART